MTRFPLRLAFASLLALTSPVQAATLFGLIDTGEIYRSTDAGASWTGIATLPVSDAVALAARLTTSDLFLVTRSGSVYRSLNAGVNWSAVGTIMTSDVVDLAIRPNGALLALTATGGVYESVNQGTSFAPLAALPGSNFRSLVITRPALRCYALTATGDLFESLDGSSWTPVGTIAVSDARRVRDLYNTLFVMSDAGDIYSSTNRGASWTPVGTLSQVGMRGLVNDGGTLLAATREGHVAASATGAAWVWNGSINQLELTALGSDAPATTSVDGTSSAPTGVSLAVPHPNPSNGTATFVVSLEQPSETRLSLYDIGGRLVATRGSEHRSAGTHLIPWSPAVPRAGLYLAKVETEHGSATRRWLIVR